jgi:hypothetical protein
MTPRTQKIFYQIFYSDLDEYEIKQLIIGLVGTMLTPGSFNDAAATVQAYNIDTGLEDMDTGEDVL